jgi:hypothetical protein
VGRNDARQPPPQANPTGGRRPLNRHQVHISVRDGDARGETTAIERAYAFGGNLAAVKPEIMDNYDTDSTVHIYVDALGADPRILHTDEERDAAREAKAQQAQAAQTAQLGMAGVTGR